MCRPGRARGAALGVVAGGGDLRAKGSGPSRWESGAPRQAAAAASPRDGGGYLDATRPRRGGRPQAGLGRGGNAPRPDRGTAIGRPRL